MSCGLGTCVDPECYLCTVVGQLPQPTSKAMLLERQAKHAVPDASKKQDQKHPSQKKSNRKALEAPGLRLK